MNTNVWTIPALLKGAETGYVTNLPIYCDPLNPVMGNINETIDFYVTGYGFLPGMEVVILGVEIVEFEIINFFKCRLRIVISNHDIFPVQFYKDNQLVDSYNLLTIEFTQRINTSWIDYRGAITPTVKTTISQSTTDNSSNAGLITNANGLTTTSTASQLFVVFPEITVPFNGRYTYESIASFSSGSFIIWTGLSYINIDWTNPRRTCLAVHSIENRSYARCYYGGGSFYQNVYNVTGVNWTGSIIHTIIEVDRGSVSVNAYSRDTLNYDWSKGNEGLKIFSQYQDADELNDDGYYPCAYFQSSSSTNYLVAQRVT